MTARKFKAASPATPGRPASRGAGVPDITAVKLLRDQIADQIATDPKKAARILTHWLKSASHVKNTRKKAA
ncbi:MAG: hypothetical protein AB7P04_12610 [Bacteriovoracia bacterium]